MFYFLWVAAIISVVFSQNLREIPWLLVGTEIPSTSYLQERSQGNPLTVLAHVRDPGQPFGQNFFWNDAMNDRSNAGS
jgi:hypothetical protein